MSFEHMTAMPTNQFSENHFDEYAYRQMQREMDIFQNWIEWYVGYACY